MLSLCSGYCRAPASCKCCSMTGLSRLSWACPSPEWLPPPTQHLVPPCRCLRCQTVAGNAELALYLFSLSYFLVAQISQCFISLSAHWALSLSCLLVFVSGPSLQWTDSQMLWLAQMRADASLSGKQDCNDKIFRSLPCKWLSHSKGSWKCIW